MSENNLAYVHVFCRDCGRTMTVIQQEDLEGNALIQVTCWQPHCLLRGFTLSLNHYLRLNEDQLEAYREIHRVYRPPYVRLQTIESLPYSDLPRRLFHFVNSLEEVDEQVVKRRVLIHFSQRRVRILHKLNEAAGIIKLICSLNREILKYNQAMNKLRRAEAAVPDVVSLEFQSRTLQQKTFLLQEQYRILLEEIDEMHQQQAEYIDQTMEQYGQAQYVPS